MAIPTNIQKALVACKACPFMPQLSLACETNKCPEPNVIGYISDAPKPEDECNTCILSDECAMSGEKACEYSIDA